MVAVSKTAVVLLAAGQSRRFGTADKLLALLDGLPVAKHGAAMLARMTFGEAIAVCAPECDEVAHIIQTEGFRVVRAPGTGKEMGQSLAIGVGAASLLPAIDAILICLADMPRVSQKHIMRLVDAHDGGAMTIIASTNGEAAMPPAIFGRGHFRALQNLQGDKGARDLLKTARLIYADDTVLTDIDRVEDLGA
jgi:molybdenum cofactor cytidylyltransferase